MVCSTDKIENISCCPELRELNLSRNEITEINDHILCCNKLETLKLSHNKLSTAKSIANITSISSLQELDLSSNKLDGEYGRFLDILSQCKHLKILSLKDNPIAKTIPYYRRMVTSRCRKLLSLDGKEVCSEERRRCNVWGSVVVNGGTFNEAQEADRRELIKILSEQSERNAKARRTKALASNRHLYHESQRKHQSKARKVASAFSPTALGLGNVVDLKPTSTFVSAGLKKAFEYLNPSLFPRSQS